MRRAATPLQCVECGAESDELATGWRAYYLAGEPDDDENKTQLITYCPECAEREFGAFEWNDLAE